MAYENPNDPYRGTISDEEVRRQARRDSELQPDPELAEGPASGARVAMFAIAIAVALGAVFYGLNRTSVNDASTSPPAQTAQTQPANPAAPSGTPKANTEPGVTTGAATNRPSPTESKPTGEQVDRAKTPDSGK
jgi:hypothetical protein